MPTNLPPEYYEVEKEYKAATDPIEKAALLEELLSTIPKHKGTDHLRANLRRKLSKLKTARPKKGVSRQVSAYSISKEGAGQVAVIGPANVGKSALVEKLTNASPEVSSTPFSTWQPTPGMMPIDNIQVQLIDTPPLNKEYVDPELLNLIRRADLVLLMVDLQTDPFQQLEDSLSLLKESRVILEGMDDHLSTEGRLYKKPCLVLANKCDDETSDENYEIFRTLLEEECPTILPISVETERNLERLKEAVFELLEVIRVYSQPPGGEPDLNSPFVMKRGGTVADFARKVHQDFYENLKAARVWGESVSFEGQMVSREHELEDGDVVELTI